LFSEATIRFGEAVAFLCGKYFCADSFVIASIIALIEFVAAAELGTMASRALHDLDPITAS